MGQRAVLVLYSVLFQKKDYFKLYFNSKMLFSYLFVFFFTLWIKKIEPDDDL